MRVYKWWKFIESNKTGSAQAGANAKVLSLFQFYCPPLPEQKAIAKILGDLDDKIELNRQINQTLEQMAQTLFKSWFVDLDPVLDNALAQGNPIPEALQTKANLRKQQKSTLSADLQALFPATFTFSEELNKWIPEGWDVKKLKDVTSEIRRGVAPKYTEENDVRVINQKCIRNHEINFNLCRFHDSKKKNVDQRFLEINDVLINSTGVGTLGRIAQLHSKIERCIVDTHVTVVRVKPEYYYPNTFGRLILNKERIIERLGEGSTGQTELKRTKLNEIHVIVPPRKLQEISEVHFSIWVNELTLNNQQTQTLTQLRDTLLPQLITGKLSVPEAMLQIDTTLENP